MTAINSAMFAINRCHQRVVTYEVDGLFLSDVSAFPINRCHQRVVTTIQVNKAADLGVVSNQ